MTEKETGTEKTSKAADETQVLGDEELTGIVGGAGSGENDNSGGNDNSGNNNQENTAWFSSPGPWDPE